MATLMPDRISIGADTLEEARATNKDKLEDAKLVLRQADGSEQTFSDELQNVLLAALRSLALNGQVTIGKIPNELTSTMAAEILSVSRPTLMKWVHSGDIDSYKVGSHTRFKRADVLALKKHREQDRRDAFAELRALDAELDDSNNA